ncbi:hypothetical protein GCM10022228_02190 [Halomonas cibimaris]|uniref:Cell division protein ZipA n=1 Tax=Halomonas cibimaris TaxID=657012 RepID=A0ABP7L7T7_9GAMM
METLPLAEILALVSLTLGLTAAAIFSGIALSRRRKQAADSSPPAPKSAAGEPASPHAEAQKPAERRQNPRQHSLFLIFTQPGRATDQRLIDWLKEKNATYDPLTQVFHIKGNHPANPVKCLIQNIRA